MATPVLATKLFLPLPRVNAVPRQRLVARLQNGLDAGHKVTLLSAPAGFGKTSLLSEWLASTSHRGPGLAVAWLSLDDGDNDPERFLSYLVASVQGALSPGQPREALAADRSTTETSLSALLNDIARTPSRLVLVLDDFQVLDAAPDALVFLLQHLPSNLHLAIASRSDPQLPLARMRGRGELTEVRAADLRFTLDESAAFLTRVMDLQLTAESIAALESRTEGWIAGLQLAALSMRDHSDIPGFLAAFTGSHRFVIDYLSEEVLNNQPEHIRSFLSHTSFLDRLSGPLCDVVTGRTDSDEILLALERNNLFVVPLDDRREWFRYHHLFADVLRARALKANPDPLPALRLRASEWHERENLPDEAIRYALAASDFDRAANLIERAMPDIRRARQDATLLAWLKALPVDVAARRPVLSVYLAWSMLVAGDWDAAERRLDEAERALTATDDAGENALSSADGEELRMLPVMIPVYRASLSQARGDVAGTTRHARRALALTKPGDHLGHGAAAGFLGMALWASGEIDAAVRTFSDARTSLRLAGNTADVLGSTVVMADMLLVAGRRRDARRSYDHSLRLAESHGEPVPQATADLHVGVSELLLDENDPDAAIRHLQTAKTLERTSLPENRYRWFVAMSRIREAEGDLDAALDLLDEAERLYLPGLLPETRPIAALKARLSIRSGRLSDAQEWADRQGLSATDPLSYLREFDHVTLARLFLAQYRQRRDDKLIRKALALLGRMRESADACFRTGSTNEILVLQALALQAQGQTEAALVPLDHALARCEPEGHLRLFLDEGTAMATLLREALKRTDSPDFVRHLVRSFDPAGGTTRAVAGSGEALSERELQVLRMLSTELSGPQIARELFVSVNTLRTHTSHIFGKLSVTSRTAAVRRAQEAGLL